MKAWVLLVFLILHQSFAHRVTISDIRSLWERTLAPIKKECILRSRVKEEVADEFFEYGLLPDDPCLKCYFHCSAFKVQAINSAGEVDAKVIADNFDYVDYPLAQKCSSIIEPDPCEKMYQVVKCIDNDLSERFPENGFVDIKNNF